jgi:dTDP-4-dehydrorhamnose reductase
MRIAVTGTTGQVVSALLELGPVKGHEVIALGRPEHDLAVPGSMAAGVTAARPDIIVSAAAFTAVDKAEAEQEMAHLVNGEGPKELAEAARDLGVPLIHLSTDYVFDGDKSAPYVEEDKTSPLGVYGASKLAGEQSVAETTDNHVILRVAWIYSPFGNNFAKTMLRLAESRTEVKVVADQLGGPTAAHDIAEAIIRVAERVQADPDPALRGIFHLAPTGEASWADFAEQIFQVRAQRGFGDCQVIRITTADYPTPARRPANSRLAGRKIERRFGIVLPHWKDSLQRCLDRLLKS